MSGFDAGARLPRPIPERIKEAREGRGFTLELFAERLGITPQAVAQYETGQISPSGEVMSRVIAITAQPPSFFVSPRARQGDTLTAFWRSLARMQLHDRRRITRRLEWARDIATYIEQFIEFPILQLPSIAFDPSTDDADQIELIAENLRDMWKLGTGPIHNLVPTAEAHGIILIRERVECEDMDAVSCWQGGRPFILYSREILSGPRGAFNLAHEIGHIVLHAGVEVTAKNLSRLERQANRFAGAFLLPREVFSREVFATSLEYFKYLKERWGVAISAMAYRAKDLGIINDHQYAYVFRQLNAQGMRKVEPLDDAFQLPAPTVMESAIRMLVDNGVQTKAQIERAINLNASDIEGLCGLEPGYLDFKVVSLPLRLRQARSS
jgi:Zn-dependent peptidase ImmA (M78 family)/DNA-binding XRE family transcriptional regulator